ncbi:FAD-binding dehydrogenase [Brachybacterium sp. EF45031]|uniref:FAD-binding dehydrogenase n=1 Tax=Brachybacterium sillae TaxID=2810536 RepID=UPI00217D0421|nr:FAD-binding dehydrogenase [Brachybacterium sillae]MCS6712016.1 FAD-binding dehydrogenase [Brachybacterium sillae]
MSTAPRPTASPAAAPIEADAIVVGAGLAGLVATAEIAAAGRTVLLVEREGEQDLGGQAHWSFGGLFLIDSPEQRRLGVHDSLELARQDWFGSAQFDRPEDHWPRVWAEAYLEFAAGEKRAWLRERGHRIFPVIGWAERGDGTATGHGNSVPRFHVTWGTGPGIVEPFERIVRQQIDAGRVHLLTRHAVDDLIVEDGRVVGVRGGVLAPSSAPRGTGSTRERLGDFTLRAPAVVVATGGIGGNPELVRSVWPERLGTMPTDPVIGVPASVDGSGLLAAERAGGRWINRDRMWHYTEGLRNWDPIWAGHGIRILPGPSSLWLDAHGRRLPAPALPGFDTLATLRHLRTRTDRDWSWFVLNRRIIEKEFTLSGSEQNPDLTGRDWRLVAQRVRPGAPAPVQAFLDHGEDFVQADDVPQLVARMNVLAGEDLLDADAVERLIRARDAEVDNPFGKDQQITAIRGARNFLGDRLIRTAAPHRLLDPAAGPLIAVRLHVLLRKTLGGLETDLSGRVQGMAGTGAVPGLYAAGETSGFGGGGMHGYSALEGTFLGGCLFSGRQAGRGVLADLRDQDRQVDEPASP